jgi:alkylglycerol monooxygenase
MLANVYAILTPFVVLLLIAEILYCWLWQKAYIRFTDAVANMGTAIGNQCVNVFVATLVIWSYGYLYRLTPFKIETTVVSFLVLLVLFDFLFYWFHRWGHSVNILWAAHMPHHTSEEMNLFVALRSSVTQRLFSFFFMWPLALIGFDPAAIYAASAVQLIIAFWHHTKVIHKMGWFEIVFNSPSHHRVHHGINDRYLDKNFGEIFIVWDKWFGTYAEEKEEVVFGALTPPQTWNPNKIYFQYWAFLWSDAVRTRYVWDKIRLWFMPLGWRPRDLRDEPVDTVDAHTLVKFDTPVAAWLRPYLVLQIVLGLILMGFAINLQNALTLNDRLIMTGVIWLMITAWGGLLENKPWAIALEPIRLLVTAGVVIWLGAPWPALAVWTFALGSAVLVLGMYVRERVTQKEELGSV